MSNVYCSVYGLSGAAVSSLVGIALVGIAFSTDNWQHIGVNRSYLSALNISEINENIHSDLRYFDRVRGLFRVCFPFELRPKIDGKLYLNPVEEWCTNVDYQMKIMDGPLLPSRITHNAGLWFHFIRTSVAGFICYFMLTGVACVSGLIGCWRASGDNLISTSILMFLASLTGGLGMTFWHVAELYELEKVKDEKLEFFLTWPDYLQKATHYSVGWSYLVAWIGVVFTLASSLFFLSSSLCIRKELKEIRRRNENLSNKNRINLESYATLQAEGGLRGFYLAPPTQPPPLPLVNYYSGPFSHPQSNSFDNISHDDIYMNGLFKPKELVDAKL
ncbi:uncharacterized protein [Lepeophtheirus salmonis]|uniref:Uncharacterized protein n=1 Tax=Lepeophtheirus salmonis TaxID=72036 RepID=A0A0K2UDJ5_LEPSM|nr:uncharacterized protein LOC121114573 [Lepeophtheirus salmonis]